MTAATRQPPNDMVGIPLVLVSFALGWLVTRLAVAIALWHLRKAADAPWPERARLAFPARQVVRVHYALVPLALGGTAFLRWAPDFELNMPVWGVLCGLAGLLGVVEVARKLEWKLCRQSDLSDTSRRAGFPLSALFILLLMLPYALMLMLIPARWGWNAALVLLLGVVLITLNAWGFWLIPLRWAGMLRNASPRLAAVVERTAARVGVRPSGVTELASPNANAFALVVPRFLIFTDPIVDVLDDDELGAITAHELGHLNEPWGVYLTRVAGSYVLVAFVASIPLVRSFGILAGLAPQILGLVGFVVLRKVGRRMEVRADRLGREHEGETQGTYARALEKMYEANLLPVVMRGKGPIHPHLYDRLTAAGAPPPYPRPKPPRRIVLAWVPIILLIQICIFQIASGTLVSRSRDKLAVVRETRVHASVGAGGAWFRRAHAL
jgi:Zn-dependent protease with chaperone function